MVLLRSVHLYGEDGGAVLVENKATSQNLLLRPDDTITLAPGPGEAGSTSRYRKIVSAFGTLGILHIGYDSYLVAVTDCRNVGRTEFAEFYSVSRIQLVPIKSTNSFEEQLETVRKLLSDGTFYFAVGYDLSLTATANRQGATSNQDYVWNRFLQRDFLRFGYGDSGSLLSVLRGYVDIKTVYVGSEMIRLGLICRQSSHRATTSARGLDDEGHVAQFMESEQIVWKARQVSSYLQVRGSPSVFWRAKSAMLAMEGDVRITRALDAMTPAFDLHVSKLRAAYGQLVWLDLLNASPSLNEIYLSSSMRILVSSQPDIPRVTFDYVNRVEKRSSAKQEAAAQELLQELPVECLVSFSHYDADTQKSSQSTVVRSCCLDGLDRSHGAQTAIAVRVLHAMSQAMGLEKAYSKLENCARDQWRRGLGELVRIQNPEQRGGDTNNEPGMSGLHKSIMKSITQAAATLGSLGTTSLWDAAIKLTLGETVDIYTDPDALASAGMGVVISKAPDFSTTTPVRVFVGSWCVEDSMINGKGPMSYGGWIHPGEQPFDVAAISLQSLPGDKLPCQHASSMVRAAMPTSHALVFEEVDRQLGVALYVFVRRDMLYLVKEVYSDTKRVFDVSGRMGAVVVRFGLAETSFLFAGLQLSLWMKGSNSSRNSAYSELVKAVRLGCHGTFQNHDVAIVMGDLGYRVDCTFEEAQLYLENRDWKRFMDYDQLRLQQRLGKAFEDFVEQDVAFAPTGYYNIETGTYNYGDKNTKIPCYPSRILCGRHCKASPVGYTRPEVEGSKQRPISAIYTITVDIIDHLRRDQIMSQALHDQGIKTVASPQHLHAQLQVSDSGRTMTDDSASPTPLRPPPLAEPIRDDTKVQYPKFDASPCSSTLYPSFDDKKTTATPSPPAYEPPTDTTPAPEQDDTSTTPKQTERPPSLSAPPKPPPLPPKALAALQKGPRRPSKPPRRWTPEEFMLKFVNDCIKFIEKHGITEGIYRLSGTNSVVTRLATQAKNCQGYGVLDGCEVNDVAGALKALLRDLKDPLLTFQRYDSFLAATKISDWDTKLNTIRDLLEDLPDFNFKLAKALFAHLYRMAQHSDETKMTASNLAICFGPTIMRPPDDQSLAALMNIKPQNALCELLIDQHEWLFEGKDSPQQDTTPSTEETSQISSNQQPARPTAEPSPLPPEVSPPSHIPTPTPTPENRLYPTLPPVGSPTNAHISTAGQPSTSATVDSALPREPTESAPPTSPPPLPPKKGPSAVELQVYAQDVGRYEAHMEKAKVSAAQLLAHVDARHRMGYAQLVQMVVNDVRAVVRDVRKLARTLACKDTTDPILQQLESLLHLVPTALTRFLEKKGEPDGTFRSHVCEVQTTLASLHTIITAAIATGPQPMG